MKKIILCEMGFNLREIILNIEKFEKLGKLGFLNFRHFPMFMKTSGSNK